MVSGEQMRVLCFVLLFHDSVLSCQLRLLLHNHSDFPSYGDWLEQTFWFTYKLGRPKFINLAFKEIINFTQLDTKPLGWIGPLRENDPFGNFGWGLWLMKNSNFLS